MILNTKILSDVLRTAHGDYTNARVSAIIWLTNYPNIVPKTYAVLSSNQMPGAFTLLLLHTPQNTHQSLLIFIYIFVGCIHRAMYKPAMCGVKLNRALKSHVWRVPNINRVERKRM